MPAADWEEGPGLTESAWRYKYLLAVVALLCGAAAYFGSSLQPVRYEGVARVLVVLPDSKAQEPSFDPKRNLQNQAEYLISGPVLQRASKLSGLGLSLERMRKLVTVEPSKDSDVIIIHALDPTAKGAAKLADSVSSAYAQVLDEQAEIGRRATLKNLQQTRQRVVANLVQVRSQLAPGPVQPGARGPVRGDPDPAQGGHHPRGGAPCGHRPAELGPRPGKG